MKTYKGKTMKKINLNDVGLILSVIAFILAILNIFWIDIPRDIIYVICLLSVICNWAHALRQYSKYSNLYLIAKNESLDLLWSYREMGRYINKMNIPELHDLDLRIENEIQDVKVRKEELAETLGVKWV